jgi:hypothetical protein
MSFISGLTIGGGAGTCLGGSSFKIALGWDVLYSELVAIGVETCFVLDSVYFSL